MRGSSPPTTGKSEMRTITFHCPRCGFKHIEAEACNHQTVCDVCMQPVYFDERWQPTTTPTVQPRTHKSTVWFDRMLDPEAYANTKSPQTNRSTTMADNAPDVQNTVRCLIACITMCLSLGIICTTICSLPPDNTRSTQPTIAVTPERIKLQSHKTYTIVDENDRERIKLNLDDDPKGSHCTDTGG